MECAQEQMFIPQLAEEVDSYLKYQQFNANVMVIKFNILKDNKKITLGDPIFCKQCRASLNKFSKIEVIEAEQQQQQQQQIQQQQQSDQQQEEEEQKQQIQQNQVKQKLWVCEFCSCKNTIIIEDQEIPQEDDLVYMIQSNNQANQIQSESDISIIFCIDNSGSMAVTSEIKGNMQLKRATVTKEEIENLKQFMEPQELQYYLKEQNKQQKFVSRKNCVLAAIESQLEEQIKQFPNRKVGLVVFGDEVILIGDGFQNPITLAGDKLQNYEQLLQEGKQSSETHLQNSVGQSYQKLLDSFEKLQEKGKTALGPALLASVGLASKGKPGSMIIMCTDGLANIGVGALDNDQEAEKSKEFYENIGNFAQEKGIIIQTITMKGEQCNVLSLGALAEKTNGKIKRVNPERIQEDFANVMNDEVLATGVQVKFLLHAGLQFKSIPENDEKFQLEGQQCTRKIGIVTEKTQVSFEYDLKNSNELQQEGLDLKIFKEVPFQAHIFFTSQEGHNMVRVITKTQSTSNDIKEVRKKIKLSLLNKHVEMQSAQQAYRGKVQEAQFSNQQFDNFLYEQEQLIQESDLNSNEESKDNVILEQQYQQELQEVNKIKNINKSNKAVLKKSEAVLQNKQQKGKLKEQIEEEEENAMDLFDMF